MLLFDNCLPLPMKETNPLRVIFFTIYCGKTFMSPDGLISSVGTTSKTCKKSSRESSKEKMYFYLHTKAILFCYWLALIMTCLYMCAICVSGENSLNRVPKSKTSSHTDTSIIKDVLQIFSLKAMLVIYVSIWISNFLGMSFSLESLFPTLVVAF